MNPRRHEKTAFGAVIVSMTIVGCQFIGGIEVIRATDEPQGGLDVTTNSDAQVSDAVEEADAAEGGPASGPQCVGLAATCAGNKDCCASNVVVGGTFNRSNAAAFPATVSAFKLDVYEITVGRFRAFVNAGKGTQTSPPAAGDGAHPKIAFSGWDPSFNGSLTATTAALKAAVTCNATLSAWTEAPNGNETRPMNCITWFEAFAFCAWDGGRLPTETEANYAATGGSEQRAYPWGAGIDASRASYGCAEPCALSDLLPVGSKSPQGDGKWGQADLAGSVWEWALDWFVDPYRLATCNDCADLQSATNRVFRGAGFENTASFLLSSGRNNVGTPTLRAEDLGARCARAAP